MTHRWSYASSSLNLFSFLFIVQSRICYNARAWKKIDFPFTVINVELYCLKLCPVLCYGLKITLFVASLYWKHFIRCNSPSVSECNPSVDSDLVILFVVAMFWPWKYFLSSHWPSLCYFLLCFSSYPYHVRKFFIAIQGILKLDGWILCLYSSEWLNNCFSLHEKKNNKGTFGKLMLFL